jgi:predicted dehydrogenase
VEVIKTEFTSSGVLGPVTEIQTWTNRPIWPQGIGRPTETPPVPEGIDWDCFLGPAPERPYSDAYHPFKWRGWLDFGTGALGDMACHTINVAVMGLELYDPESIEVLDTSGIVDDETYAEWSIIKYHFGPRNGRGPLTMTWYSGGERVPEEKRHYRDFLQGQRAAGSGLIIVGEKGSFYSANDYGSDFRLTPTDKFEGYQAPEPTLPRSPGHFTEFVEAIRTGDPSKALSNFDYAGPLTETVLLGVVAEKANTKIEWDAENMRAKGDPDDKGSIRRDYRKGFSIHD